VPYTSAPEVPAVLLMKRSEDRRTLPPLIEIAPPLVVAEFSRNVPPVELRLEEGDTATPPPEVAAKLRETVTPTSAARTEDARTRPGDMTDPRGGLEWRTYTRRGDVIDFESKVAVVRLKSHLRDLCALTSQAYCPWV
jgi:hypothetical protein